MTLLPIFPLNSVLFPGGTMPLHIFEPRYRELIGDCLAQDAPFGVALIRSGPEVGDYAEPFNVGTSARITRAEELPDGRLNIVVVGQDRFRILSTNRSRAFLQAEVEWAPRDDAGIPPDDPVVGRARRLFEETFRLSLVLGDQWASRVGLPAQPGRLADFVAARLEMSLPAKQRLLETDSVRELLEAEAEALEQAAVELQAQVALVHFKKYRDFGQTN